MPEKRAFDIAKTRTQKGEARLWEQAQQQQRQLAVYCRSRESKMEIPVSIVSGEGTVKKLISAIAVLLFTGAAACGQPPNPLIGTWKAVPSPGATTVGYCASPMVFTSTTQTLTWPGQQPSTEKVNYIAAQTSTYPTTVYVTGNTSANHQTYEFSSKNSMVLDDAGLCHYQRQ